MATIEGIISTIQDIVVAAVTQAAITEPGQCYIGYPAAPDLMEILNSGGYAISFYPLATVKTLPPRGMFYSYQSRQAGPLSCTNANNVLTFQGASAAGLNVYVNVQSAYGAQAAFYQTQPSDTLASVASSVASAISGQLGVTATSSGASVQVSNLAKVLSSKVSGVGTTMTESTRLEQTIQLDIWCREPSLRLRLVDAIMPNLGSGDDPFIDTGDGLTSAKVSMVKPALYNDDSQLDYNLYRGTIVYSVTFSVLRPSAAYAVGEVNEYLILPSVVKTISIGGSQ